jgi:hypothetical protein
MEAVSASETAVNFYLTTRCNIPMLKDFVPYGKIFMTVFFLSVATAMLFNDFG